MRLNSHKTSLITATTLAVMLMGSSAQAENATTDPVVVTGQILDAQASPSADTEVVLLAWPKPSPTARVGDSFKSLPISRTTTDSSGNFSLSLRYTKELEQYIDAESGLVDLEVLAGSRHQIGAYRFSVVLHADQRVSPHNGGALLARDTSRTQDSNVVLKLSDGIAPAQVSVYDNDGTRHAVMPKGCTATIVAQYNPYVLTGTLYSTWSGFQGSYKYTTSAASTLGTGFSVSGAFGSFSVNGTSTKSSTQTYTWPKSGNFKTLFKPQWRYEKQKVHCVYLDTADYVYYDLLPRFATGGASTPTAATVPVTPSKNCVKQSGFTWSTTNQSALTWNDGVALGSFVGLNFSSKTNWASSNKISITTTAARKVCGTHDVPGSSLFGQIVARPS